MTNSLFKYPTLLAALLCSLSLTARTVSDFFTDPAADHVFGLVDCNTRLDMIDYYNSGINHTSTNILDGEASITDLDSEGRSMRFSAAKGVDTQLVVLNLASDTVLMVIETLPLPQLDSRISFYDEQWNPVSRRPLSAPVLADWLTEEGKARRSEVEALIPFILEKAEYDPDSATLTMSHTMDSYLADKDAKAHIAAWLRPSLSYKLKGKKFVSAK